MKILTRKYNTLMFFLHENVHRAVTYLSSDGMQLSQVDELVL